MESCSLLKARKRLKDKSKVVITEEEVIRHCEKCSNDGCILQDEWGRPFRYKVAVFRETVEEVYQCRTCKTMETLSFIDGRLQPTRKFTQVGDKIYHTTNCGECRKVT